MAFDLGPISFGNTGSRLHVAGSPSSMKPFAAGFDGVTYLLTVNETNGDFEVWKGNSESGLSSFSEQDASGAPTFSNMQALSSHFDGRYLHLVYATGTTAAWTLSYTNFDTNTDEWSASVDTVDSESTDPAAGAPNCDITYDRASGDYIVIAYCIRDDGAMHLPQNIVEYAYSTLAARSWTAGNTIGNNGDGNSIACDNDGTRVWFGYEYDTARGDTAVCHVTLGTWGAGTETDQLNTGSGAKDAGSDVPRMVYGYDTGTVDRTFWGIIQASVNRARTNKLDDTSVDTTPDDVDSNAVYDGANEKFWYDFCSAADTPDAGVFGGIDDVMYCAYVREGNEDFYYNTKTDDGAWGTPTQVDTAQTPYTVGTLHASIFVRDSNYRLAYVYEEDASTMEYAEVDLGVAKLDTSWLRRHPDHMNYLRM